MNNYTNDTLLLKQNANKSFQTLYIYCEDANESTVEIVQDFGRNENIDDLAALFRHIADQLERKSADGYAAYKKWVDAPEEVVRGCF